MKSFLLLLSFPSVSETALCRYEWWVRDHVVDYLHPNNKMKLGLPVPESTETAGQYVNEMFPGPLIECNANDDIEILVANQLSEHGTSIHWHGLWMNNEAGDAPTPWSDGVHRFSHAPIMPGMNYTYKFKAWPPGTHFYHSHMDASQVDRGVKGAIIVHPEKERYADMYDEELMIVMSDARRRSPIDLMLEGQAMDTGNSVLNEVNLITWDGRYGNGTAEYPYPEYVVKPGKCYRIRWLNVGGNLQNLQINVAGHNHTIIALDGVDVEPLRVSAFNIHAGERTDAVFCADKEPGTYVIQANYDLACDLVGKGVGFGKDLVVPFVPLPYVDSCLFYAVIRYEGHEESPKNLDVDEGTFTHGGRPQGTGGGKDKEFPAADSDAIHFDLNGQEDGYMKVRPAEPQEEPEVPDMELTLYGGILGEGFKILPGGHNSIEGRGQFGFPVQAGWGTTPEEKPYTAGGRTYVSERKGPRDFWSMAPHWPSSPALLTQGKCGTNGANIIDVPEDVNSLEIMIVNLSPSAHVFHLHGMQFQVINYGFPNWCNYANHWVCFFMPYQVSHAVAKHTINGTSIASDPLHHNLGGPFYWGISPDKNHPNYKKTLNLKAPLRKDMISIWRHQWATIRLRPTNPGMWLLHCHMEQHVPSGMMVALNVKPSLQPPIPFDTPTSGNCPVHGWPHTAVEEPKEVTTELDVWDWIVNYKRATITGDTWASHRLNPNMIEPEDRASVLLVNGQSPGSTIEAVEGDTVTIRVKNHGYADALAIHFHGQEMRGTPWMDGTYGVTQAGVFPDTDFIYSFTAGPVGTHAYYGLVDPIQKARGLKGALIVRPKTDTRADLYDGEIVMQIADTWREPEICLAYNHMDNEKVGNCPPVDKVTFDGQWGDGGKYTPLPVYKVDSGKCYRLRVLAQMSQVQRLQFSIEGHSLSLLAVDGTDVTPLEVSSVSLHAGERYDFQLCANQKKLFGKDHFTILAEAPELCESEYLERTGQKAPESCSFEAKLEYKGILGAVREPVEKLTLPHLDLGTWDGHLIVQPLESPPVLKVEADASFNLTLGEMTDGRMFLHTSEMPWTVPATPLLMTKGLECTESAPIVSIPESASDVQLVINNAMPDAHVIHLHGSRFQVMSSSSGTDEPAFASSAPLLRDTVLVPGNGQVVLRMVADNPGMWMLRSMNANAHLRGAATVLNVLPSQQVAVPSGIPTGGPCAPAPAVFI